MPMVARELYPIVRRDAELVGQALAVFVLFAFFSLAVATTVMELAGLLGSMVAPSPG